MRTKQMLRLVGLLFIVVVLLATAQPAGVQALLGDLNISGSVDNADLAIIDAAYGTRSTTLPLPPNWNERADINLDGVINLSDLALAGRSFGDVFNFHFQRRVSNGQANNPLNTNPFWCDAAADLYGRVHVIWQESSISLTPLYYTLLDPSGNALIEDVLISNDSYRARLAVGPDGSAHVVYVRRFSNVGLYYTVMNTGGGIVSVTALVPNNSSAVDEDLTHCSNCDFPALAVDEYGHGHLLYQNTLNKAMYTIQGINSPLLPAAQLNPGANGAANAFAAAVSPDGARHLMWRQATGVGGGELRYTRISKEGVVTTNNRTVATLEGMYNDRRYYLASDSQSAVHFLYTDYRSGAEGIYWRRANVDGTLSAEKLISTSTVASASIDVAYVIGPSDRIHLLAPWKSSGALGYARLDRDGNILAPFQRTAFFAEQRAAITIDGSGRAMIVAASSSGSPEPLFIVSTVPDPAANDPNRADLVLDRAHLVIANHLLKINESADMRVTITNGGPATAAGIVLTFTYPDLNGVTSHIHVPVADIAPFTSREIQKLIPVPDFELVDSWVVSITVTTTTLETTATNNAITAPFGVIPPPRMFNLEITPYDETYAPDDRADAARLPGAKLELNCPTTGHTQIIAAADLYHVFWDIPLNMAPVNGPLFSTSCTVTLSKAGFSTVSTTVTAQRLSAGNPYPILLSLARPIKLYINTWGQISGVVSCEGTPLRQVQLKLDSGQTTLTADDGSYRFEKIPAGNHTVRVWAKGHTPIPAEPVKVSQGKTSRLDVSMVITFQADVFGVVVNQHGLPLFGARIQFWGDTTLIDEGTTGDDGTFAFTVAHFEDYADYRLETSLTRYDPSSVALPLMYSGLPLEQNVDLSYTVVGGDLTTSSRITSWAQDERWCQSYSEGEDLALRVEILETIGSEWCPQYQATVNWGAFDYDLGLNFTTAGDAHTVNELLIQFSNYEFISYNVSSGMWHAGGESRSVTAERIDWVELIAVDGDGNPQSVYAWRDDRVLYSSEQDKPSSAQWRLTIDTLAPDWSLAAIRIFYTVGQYVEGQGHNFKDWGAPADVGLQGSGSASGANQQVITWWLAANTSSMRYSLADYRSAVHPPTALAAATSARQPGQVAQPQQPADASASMGTMAIVPVTSGPARLGLPYAVDITLTGFETRPVYASQFNLAFNNQYLRLLEMQGGLDFGGPSGSWVRALDIAAANAAGMITSTAAVRLAAPTGLANGRVVRLVFMPIKLTPSASPTRLDLQSTITLADLDSDLFNPLHLIDLSTLVVDKNKVFLPSVRK